MPNLRHRLAGLIPPSLILHFIEGLTALQRRLERLRPPPAETSPGRPQVKHETPPGVSPDPSTPPTGPSA